METPPEKEHALSVRMKIREWWLKQVDGQEEVDIKELAEVAALKFGSDEDFKTQFLKETIQPVIYSVGIAVVTELQPSEVRTGRRRVSSSLVADAIDSKGVDWSKWLVHDPISTHHVAFLSMTKPQVIAASEVRFDRARAETRVGGFLHTVARKMKSGQIVGQVWDRDALDDLASRLVANQPSVTFVDPGSQDPDSIRDVS